MYRHLVAAARLTRPDVFVAIDFPDFNFTLAKALRKLGIPVVYYISPQLWAWRPGRMKTMRKIADRVLVFAFEERIYRDAGVPVEWVGHPLLDLMPPSSPKRELVAALGLVDDRPIVALLPGSRRNEVTATLPTLVDGVRLIRTQLPSAQVVVARAPKLSSDLFAPVDRLAKPAIVVDGRADDVLAVADIALVASGTVTVQAAAA